MFLRIKLLSKFPWFEWERDKRIHPTNAIKPPTWFCICISPVGAILAWFSSRARMTEQKASGDYHTAPSSRSPTRHWQNVHGVSNADQAAFPNRSAKTALTSFYSHQKVMVDFCHFTRRQTCREIQRTLSKLNYLCRSRFLSAISTVSNPEIQETCLFFSTGADS